MLDSKRFASIAACLAALLGLAACGGGGAGAAAPVTTPAWVETELGCLPDQSVQGSLGRLHNNTWNLASIGGRSWRQCLLQRSDGSITEPGWRWQWPDDSTGVLAYPSLVIGAKPWESGPGNDARFPRAIASLRSLVLQYTLQTESTGWNNLATSLWLVNKPTVASPPDVGAITGELMVWTRASGGDWTDGRPPDAQVSIAGTAWKVYVNPNQADASGGSTHRWTQVVYLAPGASDQARLDLAAILADAVARGWFSASDFIADVELGNEVASGSGSTWLRSVVLTVE